jgi:hypothetical protein
VFEYPVDGLPPKLHAHAANCGVGDDIGDAHEFHVQSADSEVGISTR